jgi:hypothetical protein
VHILSFTSSTADLPQEAHNSSATSSPSELMIIVFRAKTQHWKALQPYTKKNNTDETASHKATLTMRDKRSDDGVEVM